MLTSGNLAGEPIVTDDEEALRRLSGVADAWLRHDREIHVACDDSVLEVVDGEPSPLRRSRGEAPLPIELPLPVEATVAAGGDLRNTFCIAEGRSAWLSAHVGDMDDIATQRAFARAVDHLQALVDVDPRRLVVDTHPLYRSARGAEDAAAERGMTLQRVQHHHAHIASVLAENGYARAGRVLGVALDGSGHGDDGAVWGGEVLLADYAGYERLAHLAYVPLAGGDAASAGPTGWRWRTCTRPASRGPTTCRASPCARAGAVGAGPPAADRPGLRADLVDGPAGRRRRVARRRLSRGRLRGAGGDGAAGTGGGRARRGLRGGVPTAARLAARRRPAAVGRRGAGAGGRGRRPRRAPAEVVAVRFHRGVAAAVVRVALHARGLREVSTVALSGDVFTDAVLLSLAARGLREAGFEVLRHRRVPANDGGLALGQLLVGALVSPGAPRGVPGLDASIGGSGGPVTRM